MRSWNSKINNLHIPYPIYTKCFKICFTMTCIQKYLNSAAEIENLEEQMCQNLFASEEEKLHFFASAAKTDFPLQKLLLVASSFKEDLGILLAVKLLHLNASQLDSSTQCKKLLFELRKQAEFHPYKKELEKMLQQMDTVLADWSHRISWTATSSGWLFWQQIGKILY